MSLRAHLFNWFIRRQMKKGAGTPFSVEGMRAMFEQARFPLPKGTVGETARVGGVSGEWVRGARRGRRLLYIHGGGFVACSAKTHRAITGALAQRGFEVFAPDYRLAPEHPFPAGLDDVVAAYRALAAAGPLAVAGDSAGGNLALALILKLRAEPVALPNAVALFSPALDMGGSGASHEANAARDPMLNAEALRQLVPLYIGETAPTDPLVSPLFGDYAGLPPLLFHVGDREILRDDSVRAAAKAREAGVSVTLRVYPVVPHVWQMMPRFLPEARDSLDRTAAFLHAHAEEAASPAHGTGALTAA